MPDHPQHKRLQVLTKNRLKRTSLDHVLKEQQRQHQTAKQAYYSNSWGRYVLKLQSRSTITTHRYRDCHPARDNTKVGCTPHRLPICTAITRIRISRRLHLTKFNTKFKQPDIKNNSRTSMRKREARSSSQNPNLVTKKQKRSSETRG